MILLGEKKEEYREIKPYWAVRLLSFKEEMEAAVFEEMLADMTDPARRHRDVVQLLEYFDVSFRQFPGGINFRNGYSPDFISFIIPLVGITIGKGRKEWGAPEHNVFILRLS